MNWGLTYIVGGGPSAGDLNTCALNGGVVLAVNDAAFHKPCDAFFSNDHGYALNSRDKLRGLGVDKHLAIRPRHQHHFADWPVKVWTRRDEIEPSRKPGNLSSGPAGTPGCSGYVALNLAAQMGAMTIVLFGYDFHEDYRYFFSDDPYPRVHVPGVIESFRQVAPWYRRHGIEIFNANPASAIDAFPLVTHDEAMRFYEDSSRHAHRAAWT